MKYKSKLATAFLIVLFLGFSHRVSSQFRLSLNLEKDSQYFQRTSTNLSVEEEENGKKTTTKSQISGAIRFRVIGSSGTDYQMEVAYTELSLSLTTPNGEISFSSLKPADEKDIFSKLLKYIINHPFYLTMENTGKIKEVHGVDSLWSGITQEFPDLDEAQKEQIVGQLKQSYGENSLRGNIEQLTAIFPDTKVKINEEWQNSISQKANISFITANHFKLTAYTKQFADIENHATIRTTDDSTSLNGMRAKYNLNGSTDSKIKVNTKTGWIVEATINQQMKGDLAISDNPKIPGGMTIPMSFLIISEIANK